MMGEDGDDIVSLPVPPPPRPAARREAIEAALARFDGVEPVPAPRKSLSARWSTMHRRPAGALVAAAVIAIVAIPAIQVALREEAPGPVTESREPAPAQPAADAVPRVAANEALDTAPGGAAAAEEPSASAETPASPQPAADEVRGYAPADREEKALMAAPEPARIAPAAPALVSAPPPPPPPPPPPARRRAAEPQAQAEKSDVGGDNNIVVTGSRIDRPNLESAAPVTVIDPHGDFLSRLQDAFAANDRRSVIRLTALPLRVNFGNDPRTYRSARDVERDYDRIFTPEVRASVLNLDPASLSTRDGGRLKGNPRIWFGCGRRRCSSGELVRVMEVHP